MNLQSRLFYQSKDDEKYWKTGMEFDSKKVSFFRLIEKNGKYRPRDFYWATPYRGVIVRLVRTLTETSYKYVLTAYGLPRPISRFRRFKDWYKIKKYIEDEMRKR